MKSSILVLVHLIALCVLQAQNAPAQAAQPQSPAQHNPFEAIPGLLPAPPPKLSGPAIKAIEFRGANRILQSALRAVIFSRVGEVYDVETLQRDSQALKNTRRFSHVGWEAEPGPSGAIVRFVLVERPLIESVDFQGDSTVTLEEVLERLEQRKVNLKVETLFDEDELPRAAMTVQELVAERGRKDFTVSPLVERLGPPSIARITFRVANKREKR